MTNGDRVSARDRGRTRTHASRPRGWAALLGHAGTSERGRGRVAAGPFGWAEPGERKRSRPELSFFFSFSEM
jgi:hypothetical protein